MNPLRLGRPVRGLVVICASSAMLACSERSPAGPADRPTPNFIRLQSDVGDYIGAGQNYEYTQANAILSVAGRNPPTHPMGSRFAQGFLNGLSAFVPTAMEFVAEYIRDRLSW